MNLAEALERQIHEDEIYHKAMDMFDIVYCKIESMYCDEKSIATHSLSKEEKEKIDSASFLVFSNINIEEEVTEEIITNILFVKGGAKFDRCVAKVFKGLIGKEKKPVSTKKRKSLRSRSFAICTAQLGKKEAQK